MNEKLALQVWNLANQFVGKTLSAPHDFDTRQLINESKENAKTHEWLYHCTTTDGLLGILRSKEFWLQRF